MRQITELNLEDKISDILSLIRICTPRQLTHLGKITSIKSLLISKTTHILLSLPNPTPQILDKIDSILKNFLWSNKLPKYNKNILLAKPLQGVLGYPDLVSFNNSLNLSWGRRLLTGSNKTGWRVIAQHFGIIDISKYGDMYVDKLRIRTKNEFWDHVLQAVKHLYQTYNSGRIDPNWMDLIWFNSDINFT